MEKLVVNNLSVQYRYGALAVSDLSFCAKKGVTCVIGSEESGKTTLFKTIAGIKKQASGTIYFDERNAENLSIKDRNVCLLYEDGGFFERKTARKNLEYALEVRSVPKDEWEKRITDAAERVGFELQLLDVAAKNLSQEQRLYLAFARALLRKADVYLIDDAIKKAEAREKVFLKIAPLLTEMAEDAVVLYGTEEISECEYFDSHVIFLNYGVCIRQGTCEEIKKDPVDLFSVEKFFPDALREETTIEKEEGSLFISAFGKKTPLEREKLLSEIFVGKKVLAVEILGKIELFDAKSERKIYFY